MMEQVGLADGVSPSQILLKERDRSKHVAWRFASLHAMNTTQWQHDRSNAPSESFGCHRPSPVVPAPLPDLVIRPAVEKHSLSLEARTTETKRSPLRGHSSEKLITSFKRPRSLGNCHEEGQREVITARIGRQTLVDKLRATQGTSVTSP